MALNRVVIMGRIVHDLELKQTQSGLSVLTFTVAIDNGKDKDAYFIDCVAWRQSAEFISRYFGKGRMIAVEGKLTTRSYEDKNGYKRKAVEVVVDSASFTGESRETNGSAPQSDHGNRGYNSNTNTQQTASRGNSDALSDFEEVISEDGIPF